MNMSNVKKGITVKFFLYYMLAISITHHCSSRAEDQSSSFCLHSHYQNLCQHIINVWSVLDIMRSISIEPRARVDFIHALFGEAIATLRELVTLEMGCKLYHEYGKEHGEEIRYFFEMVDHLENAFEAVFTPLLFGEEKLLATVMIELFESAKNIKRTLSF